MPGSSQWRGPKYIGGGWDDVDPAHGTLAVHDAIAAYCPQYANR